MAILRKKRHRLTGPLVFRWFPEIGGRSGDGGDRLGSLALQVRGLVRVDEVALGSLVHIGSEDGAGLGGSFLVTGSNGGEDGLAGGLVAALFSAVALGADDRLTCALDGRFMIGPGRFSKSSGPETAGRGSYKFKGRCQARVSSTGIRPRHRCCHPGRHSPAPPGWCPACRG